MLLNTKTLETCASSNFQSLLNGLDNFEQDLKNAKQFFTIPNTDTFQFQLGKNIAATEGKVVYKNQLFELICYKPQAKTFSIPLLIVPPCINKYYVLDLSSSNSFVKWLVDNNFQVFLISWINPKSQEQNFEYEDYLKRGILAATDFISKNLGYKKINSLGYCIGGTMLATAVACSNKTRSNSFNSATFLNTMLDFSEPGEIGIFIRTEIIQQLEQMAKTCGYLDGIYLYSVFNLLKSKDLIWSAYINNDLEGLTPKAFDILYWNADYTNLPEKMLKFYLRNMYVKNLLVKPKSLSLMRKKIDLSTINIPSFLVAAKSDHIVPWQASYKSMLNLGGNKTFCLTASGHVAGIINPPCNNKYAYWSGNIQESAETWLEGSHKTEGSWWGHYLNWLQQNSAEIKKSISYDQLEEIAPAPGTYCRS
jgi:polyhydroxyalkanoate synthase